MKTHFVAILAALTLMSGLSHAGFERGNGGHVVLCDEQVVFLDLFIYQLDNKKTFHGIHSEYSGINHKFGALLRPLEKLSPARAERYRAWASTFFREATFLADFDGRPFFTRGYSDVDINTKLRISRWNCKLELMIMQTREVTGAAYYRIKGPLWAKLSEDQQVIALLHEVLLRDYRRDPAFYYKKPVQDLVVALIGYNQTTGSEQEKFYNQIRRALNTAPSL
ncbi:hypothetical protein [Bdellovibrio sp. HCB2-146]|uniref:hypothetical protein n=1 Tax=Bdellovibrio sp. HCB2-146 TaxID=3394362 RepID=UPI0039BC4FFA